MSAIQEMSLGDFRVYAIGSLVRIGPENERIEGVVTGIKLQSCGHVSYEVSWWDGRTRNSEWLEGCECVFGEAAETTQIGFRT